MVFKKARRARRSRAAARSRRSSSSGLSPMNVLLAGAVYGAARPFIAKFMPNFFQFGPVDSDNVILGGAGIWAMKKQGGFMKALGAVTAGSEAGIVASRLTSTATGNSVGTNAYEY